MKYWRALLGSGLLICMIGFGAGCIAFKAVGTTGKLAATTVIVAGKTATTVVKTTGRVASTAIGASGSVTVAGIEGLAALARAGMVTFVDVASGSLVRVPWREGMTLLQAGDLARLQVARRAVALVRGGRLAYSASRSARGTLRLLSGDVVRLVAN
ncbi:MAG: hypothetical protein CMI16_00265 [Opitutaceae bacterium]|nr:hypothetical protein [Opitutaceae bacterium]